MATDTNRKNEQTSASDSASPTPASPKSFAPQLRDPVKPNAWDSLSNLTKGSEPADDKDAMFAMARSNLRARMIRARHLPVAMFGEPGWDMLLALYVDARSERRHTVSSLGVASQAPSTTALRWMDYLEKAEFVARRANPTDKRVMYIELTDKGRAAIEDYLADLLASGLHTPANF